MAYKTTVQVDGKDVEVEIPGVVAEADVTAQFMRKDAFQAELDRRVKSITQGMVKLDDVETNDELKKQLMERLGVKPSSDGAADDKAIAEQIAKAKDRWVAEFNERELKPLTTKVQKLEAANARHVSRSLQAEILAAAAAVGVKPALLTPPSGGAKPPIVAMLESAFGFDADTETWLAREGDGFKLAPNPSKDRLHMSVQEFIKEWAGRKEVADLVAPPKQDGPGLGGTGGKGSAGRVILTREEASDAQTYEAALEKVGGDFSKIEVRDAS